MLHKKLSPQNSCRASKKFLEEKTTSKKKEDQDNNDQTRDRITTDHVGSKWVKTDSECKCFNIILNNSSTSNIIDLLHNYPHMILI